MECSCCLRFICVHTEIESATHQHSISLFHGWLENFVFNVSYYSYCFESSEKFHSI